MLADYAVAIAGLMAIAGTAYCGFLYASHPDANDDAYYTAWGATIVLTVSAIMIWWSYDGKIRVTALWIYPIKGCRGIRVQRMKFDRAGPEYDRRWMVIDAATSRFLSQREHRALALVVPELNWAEGLALKAPGMDPLLVPPVLRSLPAEEDILTVTVWDDEVEAAATNKECDEWFTKFLRKPCRLVRMLPPKEHERAISPKHVPLTGGAEKAVVSFADGFPGLLLAEESLTELNSRCGSVVSARNFRPNVVVQGAGPWSEDEWKRVSVGSMSLCLPKPCTRCAVPTIHPITGAFNKRFEPLKTLRTYRSKGDDVFVGQNFIHESDKGEINEGDVLEVLETKPALEFTTIGATELTSTSVFGKIYHAAW